jgi:hypothetical protein
MSGRHVIICRGTQVSNEKSRGLQHRVCHFLRVRTIVLQLKPSTFLEYDSGHRAKPDSARRMHFPAVLRPPESLRPRNSGDTPQDQRPLWSRRTTARRCKMRRLRSSMAPLIDAKKFPTRKSLTRCQSCIEYIWNKRRVNVTLKFSCRFVSVREFYPDFASGWCGVQSLGGKATCQNVGLGSMNSTPT